MRVLTAVPVYNEEAHVDAVLDAITSIAEEVLVIDDGSTDRTPEKLATRGDIFVKRHEPNRGYGAALQTAFAFAIEHGYDAVVTLDCDGQHQPKRIPEFVAAVEHCDVVSGSRYLDTFAVDSPAPADRRAINQTITAELNRRLGLKLTDAFCGFKAYRVAALTKLRLTEEGYAMPLEFWVQAARAGLRIMELPVPRIYTEEARNFGGNLDDAEKRLAYYRQVIEASMRRLDQRMPHWCCDELAWMCP